MILLPLSHCPPFLFLFLKSNQMLDFPSTYFNCISPTAFQMMMLEMTFPNDPEKVRFFMKFFSPTWFYIWLLFAVKSKFFNQSCFLSDAPLPEVLSLPLYSSALPKPLPSMDGANSVAGGIYGRRPNLASDHFSSTHTGLWKPDSVCHLVCSPSIVSFQW